MATNDLLIIGGILVAGFAAWKFGLLDNLLTPPTPPPAPAPAPVTAATAPGPAPTPAPTPTTTVVTVPVPISIPVVMQQRDKKSSDSSAFYARIENLIRNKCPNGSIGPSSSACRAQILNSFHDYATAWSTASPDLKKQIENSVASAVNCCCTPVTQQCSYSAHLPGNTSATVIQGLTMV